MSADIGILAATTLTSTATIFLLPRSSQSNTIALEKVSSSNTFSSSEYEQADTAWNVLKSFSILYVKEGKHRLLQQALRSCQSAEQYTLNITICIEALSSSWTFQASRVDSWKESLQLHEHVKTVVSCCVDCPLNPNQMMQAAQLSKDSAVFSALTLNACADAKTSLDLSLRIFRYQGMFSDSKASLSESLELFHRLNQKDFDVQNGIAMSLHEIGLLELKQHNLVDAEAHLLESLRLRRKNSKLEECDAAIAATLHQIAAVYVARKPPLLDNAKSLLLEALGLCSQSGERAATLKQLARVTIRQVQYQRGALALQQERFDDAWLHFTETLRIRRHVYSYARSPKDSNPVHMEVSCVLHELGCVGFARGSYAESKDMFSQEKEMTLIKRQAQGNSVEHQDDRFVAPEIDNASNDERCGAIVEFRDAIVTHIDSTAENYRSEILHTCDDLRDALRSRGIKVHDSFLTGK
ncbi:hypothetical protein ACHAWO_001076 [Cyclotella atomus]|uniref:Uncharacterized protein n=1 Tax=Cyclotella atomus TaxID=382360 RepID=A0ABD3PJN2_9STRA